MRIQTFLPVLALLGSACSPAPDPGEQLFNGKDMTGWRHVGKGEFVVQDGLLKTVGGMGLLAYDGKPIGNAVLRVVYKPENPLSNAGVFIRIPEQPQDAWYPVHHGYEVQIQDDADEFHRTGSIYSLSQAETFPPSDDGWNTLDIALDGQTTTVSVNGKVVDTFRGDQPVPERVKYYEPQRGPRPDSGYIGLQNHDEKSTVLFREVSLHPLPQK
ncbi:MAG: DUF1080 domain-containing protein [Bryobacterales bacterium]